MISYEERRSRVREAVAQLPKEFGLKSFQGKRFRANERHSFWNEDKQEVQLAVDIRIDEDSAKGWASFTRGTLEELKRLAVELSPEEASDVYVVRLTKEEREAAIGFSGTMAWLAAKIESARREHPELQDARKAVADAASAYFKGLNTAKATNLWEQLADAEAVCRSLEGR